MRAFAQIYIIFKQQSQSVEWDWFPTYLSLGFGACLQLHRAHSLGFAAIACIVVVPSESVCFEDNRSLTEVRVRMAHVALLA